MKTLNLFKNAATTALSFFGLLLSLGSVAQSAPELVFTNSVLESGVNGQDGAKYRFKNVTSGVDAVVEIKGRSASNVVVNNIDVTSTGWDKAFQPEVGIPGTATANQNWWVEFRMCFYKSGTTTKSSISQFVVTGLDIDGDGSKLYEWVEMQKIDKVSLSANTQIVDNLLGVILDLLSPNNSGEDHLLKGPTANYSGIDTAGTSVMATYTYINKDEIRFKLGGTTGNQSSTAAMRLNSFWFKEFNLNTPHTLPLNLLSFNAVLNKQKADLKWSTSHEVNVSHFVVQKSTDGKEYKDAALVFAYGNTSVQENYSYSDNLSNTGTGIVYYRLKMQDVDGRFTYSPVRMIRLTNDKNELNLTVFPNPVVNELRITIPSGWQGKEVKFEIFNGNGQMVKVAQNGYAGQTTTILMSDLAKGMYILRASNGTDSMQQKIIKN